MELNPTEIAAAVIISVATLLSIVAAAIPDWIVVTVGSSYYGSTTTKMGLFKTCVNSVCVNHSSAASWVQAAGAMIIIGVLCNCVALIMNLLVIFLPKARLGNVFTGATTASAFAGVLLFLGSSIWMGGSLANLTVLFSALAAGPYLCYVAMIFSFIHSGMTSSARKTFIGANQVVAVPGQIAVVSQPGPGYPGQPGPAYPGHPGQQGYLGHPGQQAYTGQPGKQAYPGQPGQQGYPGQPGQQGYPGQPMGYDNAGMVAQGAPPQIPQTSYSPPGGVPVTSKK